MRCPRREPQGDRYMLREKMMLLGPWPGRVVTVAMVATCAAFGVLLWTSYETYGAGRAGEGFGFRQIVWFGLPGVLVCWWAALRLLKHWQSVDSVSHGELLEDRDRFKREAAELNEALGSSRKVQADREAKIRRQDETMGELRGRCAVMKDALGEAQAGEDRAIASTRAKSEFMSRLTGDIRSPLTTILGFNTTLLEMGDLAKAPRDRVEALYSIKQKGEQLVDTLSDIQELCELELSEVVVEKKRCELVPIVEEVRQLMGVWARARGLCLVVEYDGLVPSTIETDAERLRAILINLAGNAIKFTLSGDVRLIARAVREKGTEAQMEFDMIDSGIGMRPSQSGCVFEPFVRVEGLSDGHSRGTGLGLALSRRYAELLGGDLEIVDTQPGIGTHVRLRIGVGSLEGVEWVEVPAQPVQRREGSDVVKAVESRGGSAGAPVSVVPDVLEEDCARDEMDFEPSRRNAIGMVRAIRRGMEITPAELEKLLAMVEVLMSDADADCRKSARKLRNALGERGFRVPAGRDAGRREG